MKEQKKVEVDDKKKPKDVAVFWYQMWSIYGIHQTQNSNPRLFLAVPHNDFVGNGSLIANLKRITMILHKRKRYHKTTAFKIKDQIITTEHESEETEKEPNKPEFVIRNDVNQHDGSNHNHREISDLISTNNIQQQIQENQPFMAFGYQTNNDLESQFAENHNNFISSMVEYQQNIGSVWSPMGFLNDGSENNYNYNNAYHRNSLSTMDDDDNFSVPALVDPGTRTVYNGDKDDEDIMNTPEIERLQYEEKLIALEAKNEEIQEWNVALNRDNQQLWIDNVALKTENDTLKKENMDYLYRNDRLNAANKSIKDENETLKVQNDGLMEYKKRENLKWKLLFQQKIYEGIKLNQDKILSLQRELDHERSEYRNLKNILREKQLSTSITAFPAPLSIPPFSTLLSFV